jgi:trehalose 2-sulfotransferase
VSGAERRVAGTTWPPSRTIVLCATQRTGSTLACDVLTATDRLGYPKEPFAAAAIGPCARAWGVPPPDEDPGAYLRAAVTNGTSPNGICALKVMWEDVPTLAATLGRTADEALAALTDPVALLVTRRDRLAAAISQHRAEQTGEWSTSVADGRPEPGRPDLDRVSELHRTQHDHADRWHDLVCRSGIPSAEVVYEDVAGEPWRIAEAAASLLGVHLDGPVPVETSLRVQRDAWNDEVRAAWVAATGGCPRCPAS